MESTKSMEKVAREIKFRVWDTKSKKFIEFIPPREYMLDEEEWSHHDIDETSSLIYPNNIQETFNNRLIWQQFTGLKDKNNKDIYEGDLCNREDWTGNPYYVRYSKDGWFWCGAHEDDKKFYQVRDCLYDFDRLRNGIEKCEIIGNIFENKKLLENK